MKKGVFLLKFVKHAPSERAVKLIILAVIKQELFIFLLLIKIHESICNDTSLN